ncbi:MAG: HAMP domain-containing sensor histidine kinase, partial [Myxococcota bacterium]|nr:HAMP domain-containing sensor histidine kinase [Myxococcota bacterium]
RVFKIRTRFLLFFCLNISVLFFFFYRLNALEESRVYQEHELIADRVFDELEREFASFLQKETARDYGEYAQLVQEEPEASFIVSYFQRAEGRIVSNNPTEDAPYIARVDLEEIQRLEQPVMQQKAPQDVYSAQKMLNRSRNSKIRLQTTPASVSPLEGFIERDRLVLFREVRLSDETIKQGLILDRKAFQEEFSRRVLRDLTPEEGRYRDPVGSKSLRNGAPSGWLNLDWEGGQRGDSEFHFRYIFSAPLSALHVEVQLKRLSGMQQTKHLLWFLGVISSLLVGLGLFGLYRMQRLTEDAAQQRSDFVGAVSHELRTPITSVRLYSEMLGEGLVPEEKKTEYYQTILSEAIRLGALVEDVLSFSRLDRGHRLDAEASGLFQQVVITLQKRFRTPLSEAGFVLVEDYDPKTLEERVPVEVWIQILSNLIDNARKFSFGVSYKEIRIDSGFDPSYLVVKVSDRGPGIPTEQIEEVKKPFVRGESEITRKTKGTGIGLALVEGLVSEMGGTLTLSNRDGGGLQVEIRVPKSS